MKHIISRLVIFKLAIAIMVSLSTNVYSYSLANHKGITADAVELINLCRDKAFIKTIDPSSQLDVLIKYNVHQDKLWRKARLWHFPNDKHHPPEEDATNWVGNTLVVSTSFDVWSDYLFTQVSSAKHHQELYPALGALLHYVQDVAVPAHAVPIFHPVRYFPPKSDGFDDWDEFNDYPWQDNEGELANYCAQISFLGHSNFKEKHIILNTLEVTRKNILNGLSNDKAYDNIWLKLYPLTDEKQHGFVQYGCDSEGEYGHSVVHCEDDKIQVLQSQYIEFASRQRTLAVKASAQLIYLSQQKLSPCEGDTCLAPLGNDRWLPNAKLLRELLKK